MSSTMEQIRKDIVDALKIEIENTPKDKVGDIVFNIIIKGRQFGLTDEDMEELKDTFKKRLQKVA